MPHSLWAWAWAGLGEQNVVNIKFRHRLSVKQMHAKSVALFNRCAAADSITHTQHGHCRLLSLTPHYNGCYVCRSRNFMTAADSNRLVAALHTVVIAISVMFYCVSTLREMRTPEFFEVNTCIVWHRPGLIV